MSPNRLADAASPYLRMHASDPVDWYPWGPEALTRAKETDRIIFLSSGYSACHWCHVMQRESFADPETAAKLNEKFVSIKVDRELRPDVDGLYMDYVVATTGAGGWPMSVFLTPDGIPLMGGTYFPKQQIGRLPAFADALDTVAGIWEDDRPHADVIARAAIDFLREQSRAKQPEEPDPPLVDDAAEQILKISDQTHGGFGTAPKFPQAPLLLFLIAYAERVGDAEVLYQVEHAVQGMLRGGVFDQAGGGMARYATDEAWVVPHFEKMLYDNALLLSVLGRLHELSPSDEYAHAARSTAAFLQRDLASPDGGFFAALSADTDGVEGATYVWSYDELAESLTADELALAERHLGVTRDGNWEGVNILTRRDGRAERPEAVDAVLSRLLAVRAERPQPDVDDKRLVSWNALAARGLMEAGAATGDGEMTGLGLATLRLLMDAADGDEVPHALGEHGGVRLIEDYALLAAACLTAYNVLGDESWLADARRLHAATLARFDADGVLFMVPVDTDLPVRPREQGDAPVPSGASTAIENAMRLLAATGEEAYLDWAGRALSYFRVLAEFAPEHVGTALTAMMGYLDARL